MFYDFILKALRPASFYPYNSNDLKISPQNQELLSLQQLWVIFFGKF